MYEPARVRALAVLAVIRAAHPTNLAIQRGVLQAERRLFGLTTS